MNLLKLSFRNIQGRPLSSILSMLLLATGLSTAIILQLTEYQLTKNIENTGKDVNLVIGSKGSRIDLVLSSVFQISNPQENIPYEFYKKLKTEGKIKTILNKDSVKSFLIAPPIQLKNILPLEIIPLSMGDSYKRIRIVGTNPDYIKLYSGKLESGNLFSAPLEATIGSRAAEKLGLKVGDEFIGTHGLEEESLHQHDEFKYRVVGILKKSGSILDNVILTQLETVWVMHAEHDEGLDSKIDNEEINEQQNNHADHIESHHQHHDHDKHSHHDHDKHSHHDYEEILETIDPSKKEITAIVCPNFPVQIKERVRDIIDENVSGIMAIDPAPEIALLKSKLAPFVSIILGIAYFITIIAMFSVFIGLLNSLSARKYEIALMRVMGASRFKVLMSILFEGLLLSVLGFVLALFFGHIGMEIVAGWMEYEYQYEFTGWLFLSSELYFLCIAVCIGLISALYPAIRAYRTDIAETLSKG